MSSTDTHVLAKIPNALVETLDRGQKVVAQNEIVSRVVEHPLSRLQEGEEGESMRKVRGVRKQVCL